MRLDVFNAELFIMQTPYDTYHLFAKQRFCALNQLLHRGMSATGDHHKSLPGNMDHQSLLIPFCAEKRDLKHFRIGNQSGCRDILADQSWFR